MGEFAMVRPWLGVALVAVFGACSPAEPGTTVSNAEPLACPEGTTLQRIDFPEERGGGFAERCMMPDGVTRSGPSREWYASGKRRGITNWLDGQRHGKTEFWYESGQKKVEAQHDHWKAVGVWTNWDADGKVVDQRDFGTGQSDSLPADAPVAPAGDSGVPDSEGSAAPGSGTPAGAAPGSDAAPDGSAAPETSPPAP
jgi:hypothetical protein